jgi:Cu/Zn superoxide dismutase
MKLGFFVIGAIVADSVDDLGNKKNKKPSKGAGKGFTCMNTWTSTCSFGGNTGGADDYSGITGDLTIVQQECDNGLDSISITGTLACGDGLCDDDGEVNNNHGFHVHTYGNTYDGKLYSCESGTTGGHFLDYHGVDIGDLGNVVYDQNGNIDVNFTGVSNLSLLPHAEGYIGRRSLVMHLSEGGGPRIACCTIPEPTKTTEELEDTCEDVAHAECDFVGTAYGKINITERNCGGQTKVRFQGELDCPGCGNQAMGFHVHGAAPFDGDGNLSCAAAGGHFNYGDQIHGLPDEVTGTTDGAHYGALGNVFLAVDNRISVDVTSDRISFEGENNGILDRGMVLHADIDKGVAFQSSGDSGPRISCCKIVSTSPPSGGWCGVSDLNEHFDVRYGYDFSNCQDGNNKCKVKCKLGGKAKPKKIRCQNGQVYPSSIKGCEDARDPL